jgi:hypothetical protein
MPNEKVLSKVRPEMRLYTRSEASLSLLAVNAVSAMPDFSFHPQAATTC